MQVTRHIKAKLLTGLFVLIPVLVTLYVVYLIVSFLHIVIGELVPKSVAIRKTEGAALLTAYPMLVFRYIFIVPIWALNSTVNGILRLMRLPPSIGKGTHSED